MKRTCWITLILIWIMAGTVPVQAQESPGEAIGQAARQVKDGVVNGSKKVAEGAKKVFREAKAGGIKVARDVRSGFKKEHATQENSPEERKVSQPAQRPEE